MGEQGRSRTGIASLLHVKLSPMSAPCPTGEQQEHLDAIVSFEGAGQRRRLFWGLDILTIKWAAGDLPEECRFLLNTQLMFLKKERDPTSKHFDDDEWIRTLEEAQEVAADIPEDRVSYEHPQESSAHTNGRVLARLRLAATLALSEGELAALTTSLQQIRVGTPGGAEALAIFHLLYDERTTGSVGGPLARIKVDEKNCFGMIEWKAVREAASRFLPMHTAAAAWKHRNLSFVEQEGLSPMPKDRGAEQGDVDGLLEGSLALGMVAALTRGSIAARQAAGTFLWIAVDDPAGTAFASRPRSQNAGVSQLPAWRSRKVHQCPRPAACVAEKRRLGGSMVRGR